MEEVLLEQRVAEEEAHAEDPLAMFDNLGEVEEKKPLPKNGATKERHEIGEELDNLAALKLLEKALAGVSKQVYASVRERAARIFGREMVQTQRKPTTVIGFGERGTAYLTPSKKATTSKLDEHTVAMLRDMDVPVETRETQPERGVLNPSVVDNPEILAIVAEVVQADERLKGVLVFLKQPAISTSCVSEGTIDAVAKKIDTEEEAVDMIGRLMNISVGKFKLDEETDSAETLKKALAIVGDLGIFGA